MIPQDSKNEAVRQMMQTLESQKILQRQEKKPTKLLPTSETEELIWKLSSKFVGSEGPVKALYKLDPYQSSFSSSSSCAFTAKYIIHEKNVEGWAGGTDGNPLIAELKAIMEALERWASGIIPESELVKSTADNLDGNAIDPRKVVAYAERQYRRKLFPLTPFSLKRKYYWKSVMTFPARQTRYLPAECLYYPIPHRFSPNPYTFANSSGVAAGFSFEDALIRSLYESFERDAFMCTWLNRLTLPRIQTATLPEKVRSRIRDFEELGYKIHLVSISFSLIPVILAIAVHYTKKPALIISGASNFNVITAISKALDEAEYILSWQLRYTERIRVLKDSRQARGVLDHIAVYANQNNLSKASFLWEGPEIAFRENPFISKEVELEKLVKIVESMGREIVTADLTPPSLKKFGIWIVRSIPLGLVPISFGYGLEPLGMPRINEVRSKKPWPYNRPFLHPFA